MCQYMAECPTTRHREGTQCPMLVRKQNRIRKVEEHNKKIEDEALIAVWILIALLAVGAAGAAIYWFFVR